MDQQKPIFPAKDQNKCKLQLVEKRKEKVHSAATACYDDQMSNTNSKN